MQKEHRAPFIIETDTEIRVKLVHPLATGKHVCRKQFRITGFLVIHADLACHRLVAVDNRTGTFRHGNSRHPRTGNISQPVQRSKSPEIRHILRHHLHVFSRQPEQLNLFRSCHRIRVRNIHGRVGLETFAQVTASSFTQFLPGNQLLDQRAIGRHHRTLLPGLHVHFIQQLPGLQRTGNKLIRRFHLNSIRPITDKADYQLSHLLPLQLELSVTVRHGSFARSNPIHVCPGKRFLAIGCFLHNPAFNCLRLQSEGRKQTHHNKKISHTITFALDFSFNSHIILLGQAYTHDQSERDPRGFLLHGTEINQQRNVHSNSNGGELSVYVKAGLNDLTIDVARSEKTGAESTSITISLNCTSK